MSISIAIASAGAAVNRRVIAGATWCRRANTRVGWTRQFSGLFGQLRTDPSRFTLFLLSVLFSGTGAVVFVLRRLGAAPTSPLSWITAVLYLMVLALVDVALLVGFVSAVVSKSRDPHRYPERQRRFVFFPGWQLFEPRYVCDLRDALVEWSFVHWLQPVVLVSAIALGWRRLDTLGLLVFLSTHAAVVVGALIVYFDASEGQPWLLRTRDLDGIPIDVLTMRLDFTPADAHRVGAWRLEPGVTAHKKLLGHELRNVLMWQSTETVLKAGGPFAVSDLEFGLAVDDRPGDVPDREYRERTTTGEVEICCDGEVVLSKSFRSLAEGWNDYARFSRPSGSETASEIRLQVSGERPLYVEVPRVVTRRTPPRIVLLIVVDNLRKDRIGLYGGAPDATPTLDAFFGPYARWVEAHAQGEWTKSAFGSLFTGLYPSHHRVTNHWYNHTRLSDTLETFPEVLQRNGVYTFAYICSGRASQDFGFERGFDRFVFRNMYQPGEIDHHQVTRRGLEELHEHRDESAFIVLHYPDLHFPFAFTSPFATKDTALMRRSWYEIYSDGFKGRDASDGGFFVRQYENKLRELDFFIGGLLRYVEQSPARDNTAVILTADHAFGFPTDGIPRWPTKHLSDVRTNVPLLMRVPWRPDTHNRVFGGLAEASIDLYPTILELAGVDKAAPGYALSLLPRDGQEGGKEYAITEAIFEGTYHGRIVSRDAEYNRHFDWRTGDRKETVTARNDAARPREDALAEFVEVTRERRLVQPEDNPEPY